jgi:hypothetical protein
MTLTATGCNGGVVLEWSVVDDARFFRYTTVRASSPGLESAAEVSGTSTKDRWSTSATDATAPAGSLVYYRTVALDGAGSVIGTSAVQAATAKPVTALGPVSASPGAPGQATFGWASYGGPSACFTYYKLVYSTTDPNPSYLDGDPYWAAIGDQAATSFTVDGLVSGTTYYVRVEAVRATALGRFVAASTDVLTFVAP